MEIISRDNNDEPMLSNSFKKHVLSACYVADIISGLGIRQWTRETKTTALKELMFLGMEDNNEIVKTYKLLNN